jgi:CHASE3 domain sensor protein
MFTNSIFQGGYDPQDIFCSQRIMPDSQSSYPGHAPNPHFSQNPFGLPRPYNDNLSNFSSNSSSTNASISHMTSLYMANQRRKAFNDELNLCLNKSLEKILPLIAKQTAENIYNSISNPLIESEKNIREIKNSIETLRATLNSCNFLTKKGNDMNKMNKLYGNLTKVSDNLNNCGILLNNQVKFAQGNEEFKSQQQELINSVIKKFENIRDLLAKQKEYSGKLNECIKMSLANIIATKTNYKNELIKVQDNIRYDIINNSNAECENNQNLMNKLNNINSAINDFKNKVDSAENIYLNPSMNNISNNDININNMNGSTFQGQNISYNYGFNNNSNINSSENVDMNMNKFCQNHDNTENDIDMNNMDTSPTSYESIENSNSKGNKLGRLISQVNGGNFRF